MTADDLVERELMLNRFQRLIAELLRGCVRRTVFQPWEVELLLDIDRCEIEPKRRVAALRRYARAVERKLEQGEGPPMTLSQFLQSERTRRPSSEKRPDSTMRMASE